MQSGYGVSEIPQFLVDGMCSPLFPMAAAAATDIQGGNPQKQQHHHHPQQQQPQLPFLQQPQHHQQPQQQPPQLQQFHPALIHQFPHPQYFQHHHHQAHQPQQQEEPPPQPRFPHFHSIPITQQLFQQQQQQQQQQQTHQFHLFQAQEQAQRRMQQQQHQNHHPHGQQPPHHPHPHHLGLDVQLHHNHHSDPAPTAAPEPQPPPSPPRMAPSGGGGGGGMPAFLEAAMNFRLGVEVDSGSGGGGAGSRDGTGLLQGAGGHDDESESGSIQRWPPATAPSQREEESAIKEPFWRPLDLDFINTRCKEDKQPQPQQTLASVLEDHQQQHLQHHHHPQQQHHLHQQQQQSASAKHLKESKEAAAGVVDEDADDAANTDSNYKLFSELEAICKPGVGGGMISGVPAGMLNTGIVINDASNNNNNNIINNNNNQTGSSSALTGENPSAAHADDEHVHNGHAPDGSEQYDDAEGMDVAAQLVGACTAPVGHATTETSTGGEEEASLKNKSTQMTSGGGGGSISCSSGGKEETTASKGKAKRRKRKRHEEEDEQVNAVAGFMEGLVRQLIEHQEGLHRQFLDALERRDRERAGREEAWRRQEAAKSAREAKARAEQQQAAAAREAAIVAFLEKITGESLDLPPVPPVSTTAMVSYEALLHDDAAMFSANDDGSTPTASALLGSEAGGMDFDTQHMMLMNTSGSNGMLGTGGGSVCGSNRWPKTEVQALIRVRSGLESRFQEPGLKGPLWEEVSGRMAGLGYSRSAKRCKEKWENINKYFRKAKDSAKKRPHHSKTCPYFHQLDQLYSSKAKLQQAASVPAPMAVDTPAAAANGVSTAEFVDDTVNAAAGPSSHRGNGNSELLDAILQTPSADHKHQHQQGGTGVFDFPSTGDLGTESSPITSSLGFNSEDTTRPHSNSSANQTRVDGDHANRTSTGTTTAGTTDDVTGSNAVAGGRGADHEAGDADEGRGGQHDGRDHGKGGGGGDNHDAVVDNVHVVDHDDDCDDGTGTGGHEAEAEAGECKNSSISRRHQSNDIHVDDEDRQLLESKRRSSRRRGRGRGRGRQMAGPPALASHEEQDDRRRDADDHQQAAATVMYHHHLQS